MTSSKKIISQHVSFHGSVAGFDDSPVRRSNAGLHVGNQYTREDTQDARTRTTNRAIPAALKPSGSRTQIFKDFEKRIFS